MVLCSMSLIICPLTLLDYTWYVIVFSGMLMVPNFSIVIMLEISNTGGMVCLLWPNIPSATLSSIHVLDTFVLEYCNLLCSIHWPIVVIAYVGHDYK